MLFRSRSSIRSRFSSPGADFFLNLVLALFFEKLAVQQGI